jgi:hypothetical protein
MKHSHTKTSGSHQRDAIDAQHPVELTEGELNDVSGGRWVTTTVECGPFSVELEIWVY